jgi:hypothetical protein
VLSDPPRHDFEARLLKLKEDFAVTMAKAAVVASKFEKMLRVIRVFLSRLLIDVKAASVII